jgi:hypothetical protein
MPVGQFPDDPPDDPPLEPVDDPPDDPVELPPLVPLELPLGQFGTTFGTSGVYGDVVSEHVPVQTPPTAVNFQLFPVPSVGFQ